MAKTSRIDVQIRPGTVASPERRRRRRTRARIIEQRPEGILFHWDDVGSFLVEAGSTVTVAPSPGVDEELIRIILQGPVLGALLHQRGSAVFHASVVAAIPVSGAPTAVAIMARKGEGKSTTAAALYGAGYSHVSDDIMPVAFGKGGATTESGMPVMKLWADSAEAVVEGGEALPVIAPGSEKRERLITERFLEGRRRLAAVVVLEAGDVVRVERLAGFEAVRALLPHWYGALFDGELIEIFGRRRHLSETAELARSVPVYRLVRPLAFDRLPKVVDAMNGIVGR